MNKLVKLSPSAERLDILRNNGLPITSYVNRKDECYLLQSMYVVRQ